MKLSADALMNAPELAAVSVLEAALDATVFALAAAWPELQLGHDVHYDEPRAALDVIEQARALGAALREYRRARAAYRERELDRPF